MGFTGAIYVLERQCWLTYLKGDNSWPRELAETDVSESTRQNSLLCIYMKNKRNLYLSVVVGLNCCVNRRALDYQQPKTALANVSLAALANRTF